MLDPVILILGAGPNIGLSVANAFAAKGYKVALAARSAEDGMGEDGYLRLKLDLANTSEVEATFGKVKEKLGIPSVVVYNGISLPDRTLFRYLQTDQSSQVPPEIFSTRKTRLGASPLIKLTTTWPSMQPRPSSLLERRLRASSNFPALRRGRLFILAIY